MDGLSVQDVRDRTQAADTDNFILRSIDKSAQYYLKVPNTRLALHSSNTPQSKSPHLSFNNDHNPYTPAFVSCSEQEQSFSITSFKVQSQKGIRIRAESRSKASESKPRRSEMLLPEPTSKFCSVCRESFQNYFAHINHPVHGKKVGDSEGSSYIMDLVAMVQQRYQREEKNSLSKAGKKAQFSNQSRNACLSETSISKDTEERLLSPNFQQHSLPGQR